MKLIDLTNKIFGRWTVISRGSKGKNNHSKWLCKCECGTIREVAAASLKKGESKSCGCLMKELNTNLMIGRVFGRLTVIEKISSIIDGKDSKRSMWKCSCSCGGEIITRGILLRSGHTSSCGCYRKEKATAICRINNKNAFGKSLEKRRRGTQNISGRYLVQLRYGAKKRGIKFSITKEYIQDLLEKQNFRCALTGVPIIMDITNTKALKGTESLNTGSLDRINSNDGYIEGNVQWVHKTINNMKWVLTQKDFIYWCNKVSEYSKNNFKPTEKQVKEFYDIHI